MRVHRPEFQNLDQFIVEAIAFLFEESRPRALKTDGERDERREKEETPYSNDWAPEPLDDAAPILERTIDDLDGPRRAGFADPPHREAANLIDAHAEVDGKRAQLGDDISDAAFGAQGESNDDFIHGSAPRERDQ